MWASARFQFEGYMPRPEITPALEDALRVAIMELRNAANTTHNDPQCQEHMDKDNGVGRSLRRMIERHNQSADLIEGWLNRNKPTENKNEQSPSNVSG
jgi:hypothetical protein